MLSIWRALANWLLNPQNERNTEKKIEMIHLASITRRLEKHTMTQHEKLNLHLEVPYLMIPRMTAVSIQNQSSLKTIFCTSSFFLTRQWLYLHLDRLRYLGQHCLISWQAVHSLLVSAVALPFLIFIFLHILVWPQLWFRHSRHH